MSQYFVNDEELTSVANAIRAKSGGSNQLIYPQGFISELDEIDTGETIYTSSTGLLYTAKMTIDLSMERTNGYKVADILTRYGDMPYLKELTLTGIMRVQADKDTGIVAANGNNLFSATKYPLLKKIYFQPTEIRTTTGAEIDSSSVRYNRFCFGDNYFTNTNITVLVMGKIGGPYVRAAKYGWFRNDMPVPPGDAAKNIGSLDGLNLTIYTTEYNDCFLGTRAPNTTYTCINYETGEILTP